MLKQPQRAPRVCVFCGRTGNLSRQHVLPNRLRRIVERIGNHHFDSQLRIQMLDNHSVLVQPPRPFKKRNGHMGTRTLRVVCKPCNEGWMNEAEQRAFEVLTPLIEGSQWSLDANQKQDLEPFLGILFTMVDLCDLPTSASTKPERDRIFELHRIPTYWHTFVSIFDAADRAYWFRHYGGKVILTDELGHTRMDHIQFSTIGLGKLGLHLVSFGDVPMRFDPDNYAAIFGISRLSADSGTTDSSLLCRLGTTEIDTLSNRLAVEFIRDHGQRLTPA